MSPRQLHVLRMLRAAGNAGLTTHDLLAGGAGSRFGARIHELRAMGHVITEHRERVGSSRYRLLEGPGAEPGTEGNIGSSQPVSTLSAPLGAGPPPTTGARALDGPRPPAAVQGQLFAPEPARPASPYDVYGEAA